MMFYRMRVDAHVSAILKLCHYDTQQMLAFWPVGASSEWVKKGKASGWKPVETASLAVSQVAFEHCEAEKLTRAEAQYICSKALQRATEKQARSDVVDHLARVTYSGFPKTRA